MEDIKSSAYASQCFLLQENSVNFDLIQNIAKEHGLDEAVFVSYIWSRIRTPNNEYNSVYGNRAWTPVSLNFLLQSMPHWTQHQMRCVIKKCYEKGLILIERLSPSKHDRDHWYTLTDESLEMCMSESKDEFRDLRSEEDEVY